MSTTEESIESDKKDVKIYQRKPGEAPIKLEYILQNFKRDKLNIDYISENDKLKLIEENSDQKRSNDDRDNDQMNGKSKRFKKLHGQNKRRHEFMNQNNIKSEREDKRLCSKFAGSFGLEEYSDLIERCLFNDCKFSHDVEAFMKSNPIYLDKSCHMFDQFGFCGFAHRCKFGKSHIDIDGGTYHNKIDREKFLINGPKFQNSTKNFLTKDVQIKLRKKTYDFSSLEDTMGPASIDEREWKRIDFRNKLYLAPLTTVGNLPFRRICKEFGADITCGEMALAENIVKSSQSEWALLRRHVSEDLFGIQLAGSNPQVLAKAVKLINDECEVDFIDLNMGCPIDLLYQKGSGCALMTKYNRLNQIITSMSRVSKVPLTLKMRAGVSDNRFIADKLINQISNQFSDGRIGLITVHGRSKDARYTKSANWNYIRECAAQSVNNRIPIFGSGDVLSFKQYEEIMNHENSKVAGVMIARGALIKPWIFTEIKERRDWDISSSERLDILKKYVNYGLEQFGSDSEGVEKTRKFLLEWLSFLHRYIPVGLLEVLPQKINEPAPHYVGRDDLETLMASPYVGSWIEISEMLLGPVKESFTFLPKHKANSYSFTPNQTEL